MPLVALDVHGFFKALLPSIQEATKLPHSMMQPLPCFNLSGGFFPYKNGSVAHKKLMSCMSKLPFIFQQSIISLIHERLSKQCLIQAYSPLTFEYRVLLCIR